MNYWKNLAISLRLNSLCILAIATLFIAYSSDVHAQDIIVPNTLTSADTSDYVPQENRYSMFSSFSGKPGKASLIGLIIPGGGQIYNRKYIKAAVLIGGEASLLYLAIDRSNFFKKLDQDYKFMVQPENQGLPGPNFEITEIETIYNEREEVRQSRDYLWLGFGVAHLFVIAEAFVDRHLMEFDVSDDLSLHFNSDLTRGIMLSYSLN